MDDTTSRQQIDELADLYLTNPGQNTRIDGPSPIKLAPKVVSEATPSVDTTAESMLEEADGSDAPEQPILRLTEEAQADLAEPAIADAANENGSDETPSDEPAPQAMLEAVLLGNLPGMSGPWLTQYAQLLAQTEGPVILLHLADEAIDLELIEPRAEAQPVPSQPGNAVRIPPMRGDKTGLVGLIDALVRNEQTPARTILVRFDSTGDTQALSRLAAMDDWTLLCGSDKASIAGAGRQLRSAAQNDPRLADRNVGIMVMGSDDAAAQEAAKQIASEIEDDLANPVELVGHLKRMQPVQVRDLGSFPDPIGLWPKLVAFFDSLEVPEPIATPKPQPKPEPVMAQTPTPAPPKPVEPAASRPEPMPRFRQVPPAPAPPKHKPKTQPVASTPRATGPIAQPLNEPMRPAPTPRVLTPQPELDLVALIAQGPAALDRPVILDARIPDQPDTQLAVDAQGKVHLLKKGSGVVSEDALNLIEAGQWLCDHLELIALTQRDRDFVDTAPALHLLTDQATQLVGKLPDQVQLHLLQQVTIGKETGWFCTPMA